MKRKNNGAILIALFLILILGIVAAILFLDDDGPLSISVADPSQLVRTDGNFVEHQPLELDFAGPSSSESSTNPNPFYDYRFSAEFTSPSGKKYNIPGFFDGDGNGNGTGNIWSIRITPDESGVWSYRLNMRQGSKVGINTNPMAGSAVGSLQDVTGSFSVAQKDNNAPGFYKWGKLEYVGDHYPKFTDGPYFIKGGVDSPENLLGYSGFDNTQNYDDTGKDCKIGSLHTFSTHASDWQNGDPDWGGGKGKAIIGALNYLSSKNVNSIYFLPMNLGGDGCDTYPFTGKNNKVNYDISKLRQWNTFFSHAQKKGILLHFVLAEAEAENRIYLGANNLTDERRLFLKELIARFGYANAVKWNLSEENRFSVDMLRDTAKYINDMNPYNQLVAVHQDPDNPRDYGSLYGNKDFNSASMQYTLQNTDKWVEEFRNNSAAAGQKWVVEMDENANGGSTTGLTDSNAPQLRKEALYDTYFSGGTIEWYFGYHGLPLGGDLRTENFRTREEMYNYMWYARRFMYENLPFWEMSPNDNLVSGEDGTNGGAEVFTKHNAAYAVYYPKASSTGNINLSGTSGSFNLRWFNPRNGNFEGSTRTVNGGGNVSIGTPPSNSSEDWVVLIAKDGVGGSTFIDPTTTTGTTTSQTTGQTDNGSTTGETCSNDAVFVPNQNGVVAVDFEVLDFDRNVWSPATSPAGFGGQNYFRVPGEDTRGGYPGPGASGLIELKFKVNSSGTYLVNFHNYYSASAVDLANDFYLKMDNDIWYKNFSHRNNSWNWMTRREIDHDANKFSWSLFNLEAGEHTLYISSRAQGFGIDRVHIFKDQAGYQLAMGQGNFDQIPEHNLNEPLSQTESGEDCDPTGTTTGTTGTDEGGTTTSTTGETQTNTVTSFALINADTDTTLQTINNGNTINLADLPTTNLNIRAITNPSVVGSVRFSFNGQSNYNTENTAPYALKNESGGNFEAIPELKVGSFSVSATPFSQASAGGQAGTSKSVSFTIVNNPNTTTTGSTTGTSGEASVESFYLLNADSNSRIFKINNGDKININSLPTRNLSIEAVVSGTVASVTFDFDGVQNFRGESRPPYTLGGETNNDTNYQPVAGLGVGNHTVSAHPAVSSGVYGESLTVAFEITEGQTTKPAACKADYNSDGEVNLVDFAVFVSNYKKPANTISCNLDIVGNNCVLDLSDFAALVSVYKSNQCR